METTRYLTYNEILSIYQKMIDKSGGGFAGVRDDGAIQSILEFVQNDDYYSSFVDKLTFLVFRFCRGHYFNDGNKRIALTIGTAFLLHNGYFWVARNFMSQLEAIVYHIAASNIDEDLLHRIIHCIVNEQDYDEELKIDIANAISNNSLEQEIE